MNAKKVYEFKRTRKKGLSGQTELNPIKYKKVQVEKWFKNFAPLANYEIKYNEYYKDYIIFIYNSLVVTKNFSIKDMKQEDINLPENLIIEEKLILDNFPITKLPNFIKVKGSIILKDLNITEIPCMLYSDELIYGESWKSIEGNLLLEGLLIDKLPHRLWVEVDDMSLENCKNITNESMPDQLHVGGNLFLYGTQVTEDFILEKMKSNDYEITENIYF